MGNPVAFDASAEERDTRGFISMTTMRPFSGFTANCTFDPPVSTPTFSRMAKRCRAHALVFHVAERLSRGNGDGIARVHAHGVQVLDGADDNAVAGLIAHDLHLVFFPAFDGFFNEHLAGRRQLKALRHDQAQLLLVVRDAAAGAAHA